MEDNKENQEVIENTPEPEPVNSGVSEEAIKSIVSDLLKPLNEDINKRFKDLMENYHQKTQEIKDELKPAEEIDDNDDIYDF